MTRTEQHMKETGKFWTLTVWMEPIGNSYNSDSYSQRMAASVGTLPTEAAARRVGKAFAAWNKKRFPDREDPSGQYFVASPDGAFKVFQSFKTDTETIRRRAGNAYRDQSDAHVASDALRWLFEREREKFDGGS